MPTHSDVIESLAAENAELRRQIDRLRDAVQAFRDAPCRWGTDEVHHKTLAWVRFERTIDAALAATQEGTPE